MRIIAQKIRQIKILLLVFLALTALWAVGLCFRFGDGISQVMMPETSGGVVTTSETQPAVATDYKIGYFESKEYFIFIQTRTALLNALAEMGWKDKIEFPPDAYFSPGDLPEQKKKWPGITRELLTRKDLDLIFAAGTAATNAILKTNRKLIKAGKGKELPSILSGAVSDAVKSKFVRNKDDSGIDNFTVRIVPGRYIRMFRIFHDEVNFNKLGLLYVDSEDGRKFANVADAHTVAKERGFQIIAYKINETRTPKECEDAVNFLAKQGIDAFFIPSLTCFEWKEYDVKKFLDILVKNKIPSFARQGTPNVKAGALMGFSTVDYSARGRFLANMLIKILQGAKPRSLNMVDNAPPKIALNLYVAQQIGFDPSFDILGASDEIYQEITLPEKRLVK
ncbi:MAG: hypothetical protein GY862_35290 [Gammaproteobacteria bacterium]|nr:hypothetical protein [Gammaproteobacteria bacterium]